MKISPIFMLAVDTEAFKLHEPKKQLKRFRRNINFVWDKWYKPVCKEARFEKFVRLLDLVDRMEAQYEKCGFFDANLPNGGPAAGRKRRDNDDSEKDNTDIYDSDPEAWISDNFYGDNSDMGDDDADKKIEARLSKNDRGKAAKQVGNIIRRFGERYLADCKTGLTVEKLAGKGQRWTRNLNEMNCIKN